MLIVFDKEFAGRRVGRVENMPDSAAKVLVRKGYASIPTSVPEKKLSPSTVKNRALKSKAMADLIDTTYFNYEINIASGSPYSDLSGFITRYEKEILCSLLGYELYKLVAASVETSGRLFDLINGKEYTISYNGRDQLIEWNGLKNSDKISLIAYYVYYKYQQQKATMPGGSGEMKPKSENGVNADLSGKVMDAWSRMRELYGYSGQDDLCPSAFNFLTENATTYPEWVFTEIGNVNAFDL